MNPKKHIYIQKRRENYPSPPPKTKNKKNTLPQESCQNLHNTVALPVLTSKYIKDKTIENIRKIKRIEILARPLPYLVAGTLYGSSSPSSSIWTLYGPSSPSSSFPLSPSGLYGRANYTEYIRFIYLSSPSLII